MQQDAMQFLFDDADAKELAGELAGLIRREFPDWTPRIENRSASDPQKRDAGLAIAIVTLIVALPSGIKDGIDLAERIQLKKKIDKLLAWAKAGNFAAKERIEHKENEKCCNRLNTPFTGASACAPVFRIKCFSMCSLRSFAAISSAVFRFKVCDSCRSRVRFGFGPGGGARDSRNHRLMAFIPSGWPETWH